MNPQNLERKNHWTNVWPNTRRCTNSCIGSPIKWNRKRFAIQKKLSWQTALGPVELEEQVLRVGRRGVRLRPFCLKAQVKPKGYSRLLERALSDFGAEESFSRAADRVKEHYGMEIAGSAVRRITYEHARKIQAVEPAEPRRRPSGGSEELGLCRHSGHTGSGFAAVATNGSTGRAQ